MADEQEEATLIDPTDAMGAFSAVMDTLAGGSFGTQEDEAGEETAPDAAATGVPAPPAAADGGAATPPVAPGTQDAGDSGGAADTGGAGGAGSDDGGGAAPGVPELTGLDPSAIVSQLGDVSVKIEENIHKGLLDQAYSDVQKEFTPYFDALKKHPRLLVGEEVPSVVGEGTETLRDSADAKEWQDAVKQLLGQEMQDRASRQAEAMSSTFETLHSSVDLFKNNADLIPGTKGFDKELADTFVASVKDYEVRNDDGKLIGYGVPVQPLVNAARALVTAKRSQATAAPAAPAKTPPVKPAAAPAAPPQVGLASTAGGSGNEPSSDFSTLFGTLGLPDLVI